MGADIELKPPGLPEVRDVGQRPKDRVRQILEIHGR